MDYTVKNGNRIEAFRIIDIDIANTGETVVVIKMSLNEFCEVCAELDKGHIYNDDNNTGIFFS